MDLEVEGARVGKVPSVYFSGVSPHGSQNELQRGEINVRATSRKGLYIYQGPHEAKHGRAQGPANGVGRVETSEMNKKSTMIPQRDRFVSSLPWGLRQ